MELVYQMSQLRTSAAPYSLPPALYVRTPAHTRDLAALLVARQQGADDGFYEALAIMGALI